MQIIVDPESLDGHSENGSLVQFQGNWYRVVSTEYRDERGPGVLLYRTAAEGSRINPDRQVLVVKEDITRDECYLGEIISYTEQLWIVDDLAYQTLFGSFIRLFAIDEEKDEWEDSWIRMEGVSPSPQHRYQILHLVTFEQNKDLQSKIGFVIQDEQTGTLCCCSYKEAWRVVFEQGASNAKASSSTFGKMTTYLIDSIDGLPPLDSHYWRMPLEEAEHRWRKQFSPDFQRAIDAAVRMRRRRQTAQPKEGSNDGLDGGGAVV